MAGRGKWADILRKGRAKLSDRADYKRFTQNKRPATAGRPFILGNSRLSFSPL